MKKLGWVILDADGDLATPGIYEQDYDAADDAIKFNHDRSRYHAPYAVAKVYLKGK